MAVLAAFAAALTRTQLAILFAVLVLGLLWLGWQSERSPLALGVVALGLGRRRDARRGRRARILGASSATTRRAGANTTGFYKERIFEHAPGRSGALAIGIGILPMVVGHRGARAAEERAARPEDARLRRHERRRARRLPRVRGDQGRVHLDTSSRRSSSSGTSSTSPRSSSRRRRSRSSAASGAAGRSRAAAAFTLYVVASTPLQLEQLPVLRGARALDRRRSRTASSGGRRGGSRPRCSSSCVPRARLRRRAPLLRARTRGAYRVLAGDGGGLRPRLDASPRRSTRPRASATSRPGSRATSRPRTTGSSEETGGESVVVVGQQIADPTNVWLTEFFNPSIRKMWSLDGTAPGPGPILTPDLVAADGTLTPPPATDYALAINGVELQAPVVAAARHDDAVPRRRRASEARLGRHRPLLATAGSATATATASPRPRTRATTYPATAPGSRSSSSPASAGVRRRRARRRRPSASARSAIGPDRQPTTHRRHGDPDEDRPISACTTAFTAPRPPNVPWRVEVTIAPTFSPHDVDP